MVRWTWHSVNFGMKYTCIGQISADVEGLHFQRDGKPVTLDLKGYDHFAQ